VQGEVYSPINIDLSAAPLAPRAQYQVSAPAAPETIAPEVRIEPQVVAPAAPETIAPEVRVEPQAAPELLEGYSPEYRDMITAWRAREQELLAQQRQQKETMHDVCSPNGQSRVGSSMALISNANW
jgi:hypothetical protein